MPITVSRILAHFASNSVEKHGFEVILIDIRQYPLPQFDNNQIFMDKNFKLVFDAVLSADNILITSPTMRGEL